MKDRITKSVRILFAAGILCLCLAGCRGKAGTWAALDPETAEAIDADFRGKVWRVEEDSFYIAKCDVKVQEDGSLSSSSPSSNARLKDADLIPVIYTAETRFYKRTISGDGAGSEDTEAGLEDLELYMMVDLKGDFGADGFHASEIRLMKVS